MEIQAFAQNVKFLREYEGLKQTEMLDAIGFPRSTWNNYERGASTPNLDDLIKIAHFFGILESDLLHLKITEDALIVLHNRYIQTQKKPFELGNTPRSNGFKTYFQGSFSAVATRLKQGVVPKNVPNPVPNEEKKGKKPYYYPPHEGAKNSLVLNEPTAEYNANKKLTDTERIARLERTLKAFIDIFTTEFQ